MAAAAILNLLFLSILVTRSTLGGWIIAVCAKIQDGGRRHLGFNFC